MKKFLTDNFNPKALLSWPVFLISFGWGISTNLLDRVFNPSGLYLERISTVALAHLTMFAGIFLASKLIAKLPPLIQAIAFFPIVAGASILRGFVVWSLFSFIGIDSPEVFNYRVFGPVTNLGIPVTLTALAFHRISSYTKVRSQLLSETSRLVELKNLALERIKDNAQQRLTEIKEAVSSSLALERHETPADTMSAITKTIEDVVRPISHQIESEVASFIPENLEPKKIRLDWPEALRGALSAGFINPVAVSATLFTAGIIFVTSSHPPTQAAYLLMLIGVGSWLFLYLLKLLMKVVSKLFAPWASRILLVLGVVSIGATIGLLSVPLSKGSPNPTSLLFVSPYFLSGVTFLFTLAASTQAQAKAANERFEQTTASLAWEVTRISEEQRQMRRALSSLLHGKLQSGLTLALMKLKMAATTDPASFRQTEEIVQRELRQLLDSAQLIESSASKSLDQMVSLVQQTWEGIAQISLDVSEVEAAEFSLDPILMNSISEIIPELAFNAIKHGEAQKIDFSIAKASENTIVLTCMDNGNQAPDSGRIGLGTKLLDECALEWKRESRSTGTATSVHLPYAPTQALAQGLDVASA